MTALLFSKIGLGATGPWPGHDERKKAPALADMTKKQRP
jgi:hypothetical protein